MSKSFRREASVASANSSRPGTSNGSGGLAGAAPQLTLPLLAEAAAAGPIVLVPLISLSNFDPKAAAVAADKLEQELDRARREWRKAATAAALEAAAAKSQARREQRRLNASLNGTTASSAIRGSGSGGGSRVASPTKSLHGADTGSRTRSSSPTGHALVPFDDTAAATPSQAPVANDSAVQRDGDATSLPPPGTVVIAGTNYRLPSSRLTTVRPVSAGSALRAARGARGGDTGAPSPSAIGGRPRSRSGYRNLDPATAATINSPRSLEILRQLRLLPIELNEPTLATVAREMSAAREATSDARTVERRFDFALTRQQQRLAAALEAMDECVSAGTWGALTPPVAEQQAQLEELIAAAVERCGTHPHSGDREHPGALTGFGNADDDDQNGVSFSTRPHTSHSVLGASGTTAPPAPSTADGPSNAVVARRALDSGGGSLIVAGAAATTTTGRRAAAAASVVHFHNPPFDVPAGFELHPVDDFLDTMTGADGPRSQRGSPSRGSSVYTPSGRVGADGGSFSDAGDDVGTATAVREEARRLQRLKEAQSTRLRQQLLHRELLDKQREREEEQRRERLMLDAARAEARRQLERQRNEEADRRMRRRDEALNAEREAHERRMQESRAAFASRTSQLDARFDTRRRQLEIEHEALRRVNDEKRQQMRDDAAAQVREKRAKFEASQQRASERRQRQAEQWAELLTQRETQLREEEARRAEAKARSDALYRAKADRVLEKEREQAERLRRSEQDRAAQLKDRIHREREREEFRQYKHEQAQERFATRTDRLLRHLSEQEERAEAIRAEREEARREQRAAQAERELKRRDAVDHLQREREAEVERIVGSIEGRTHRVMRIQDQRDALRTQRRALRAGFERARYSVRDPTPGPGDYHVADKTVGTDGPAFTFGLPASAVAARQVQRNAPAVGYVASPGPCVYTPNLAKHVPTPHIGGGTGATASMGRAASALSSYADALGATPGPQDYDTSLYKSISGTVRSKSSLGM